MKSEFERFSEELDRARTLITISIKESISEDIKQVRQIYKDLTCLYNNHKSMLGYFLKRNHVVIIPFNTFDIKIFRDRAALFKQLLNKELFYNVAAANHVESRLSVSILLDAFYFFLTNDFDVFKKEDTDLLKFLFEHQYFKEIITHEISHVIMFNNLSDYKDEYIKQQKGKDITMNLLEFYAYRRQAVENVISKMTKEQLKSLDFNKFYETVLSAKENETIIPILNNIVDVKSLKKVLKKDFENLQENNFLFKESIPYQKFNVTDEMVAKLLEITGLSSKEIMNLPQRNYEKEAEAFRQTDLYKELKQKTKEIFERNGIHVDLE